MTQSQTKNFAVIFILFLFFLAFGCSQQAPAQGNVWYKVFLSNGKPTTFPANPATKFMDIDSVNKDIYIKEGNTWVLKPNFLMGEPGSPGKDGITPMFQTGNTITGAPGSAASLTVRPVAPSIYAIDANVPQGMPGQNGSGGGIPGFLSPDNFGAKHTAQFISSADLPQYSSVGATTSDTYDWASWAMCMAQCDMKAIVAYGVYYWNRSLIKPANAKCKIIGNNAKAISTNNGTWSMLTTVMPADFSAAEARCGAGANFVIEDFRMEGVQSQIAFQPFATSDNYLRNVTTAGFGTGLLLQFCLGGIYDNITCLNGANGLLLKWGGYPGDTPISSRYPTCNGSKIRNYHAVNITNIGIANYGAYDVVLDIKAIEGSSGGTINRAIDIDDMGNTGCKNFFITSGDFEGITIANGAGNAYLHLKTVVGDSRTSIRGTLMHTAGKFIWAEGANDPLIIVDRVNWIVTQQCLVSQGYTWQFDYCSAFPFPNAINGRFSPEGVMVTACNPVNGQPTYNAQGCGANHYNYLTGGK